MKKTRKYFAILLALVMTLTAFPLSGLTASAAYSGDFVYEVLSETNKTCEITGYTGYATALVIPSELDGYTVTSIGDFAFYYSSLESITIPNRVTNIGNDAFASSFALSSITLPDSITRIGSYAFDQTAYFNDTDNWKNGVLYIGKYCVASSYDVETVQISAGTELIADAVFGWRDSLTSITLPDSMTSIGEEAFNCCPFLATVTIPSNVTSIGDMAFYNCTSLTNFTVASGNSNYSSENGVLFNKDKTTLVQYPAGKSGAYVIPGSVTTIGENAFYGCTSLTKVTIPNTVTSIEASAFESCSALTSVTIPTGINRIEDYAFAWCGSLKSVTIPNSVISIGGYAFRGCRSLTSITIPNSVTSIGEYAFSGTSITALNLPNGLQTIEYQAFAYTPIESIRIPDSVTEMVYSFYGSDIQNVEMPDKLVSMERDFHNTPWYEAQADGSVYLGKMYYAYKGTASDNTQVVVKDGTLGVSGGAFAEQDLSNVSLPEGLLEIGNSAFFGCHNLSSVSLPSTLQAIRDNAFEFCSSLTSITIPDRVTQLGNWVFSGCESMTQATIGNSVQNVDSSTFSDCYVLENILVNPGNSAYCSISGVLFNIDRTELILYPTGKTAQTYTVPNGVTSIGDYAFLYCNAITDVILPGGVTSIGEGAFSTCEALKSITIPESVSSIGVDAFWRCTALTIYGVDNSYAEQYATLNAIPFAVLTQKTDNRNNIVVTETVAGSLPDNSKLETVKLSESGNSVEYRITLTQNGAAMNPGAAVVVKIPVPQTMNDQVCRVYCKNENDTYKHMLAVYQDGFISFTTNTLGTYVLTTEILETAALGDVNGDGTIDAADAVMIQRYDSGLTTLTDEQLAAADVNADGLVDAADAVKIQRYDAGLIASL